MWNTDVLNPSTRRRSSRAGREPDDPRSDTDERRVRPLLRQHPASSTTRRIPLAAMAGSFVDNGYRGYYELSREVDFGIAFAGGQWTGVRLRRSRDARRCSSAYTWLTGRAALPPLWALGYHQCRYSYMNGGRGPPSVRPRVPHRARRRSRATRCIWTSTTWTATGVHLGPVTASRSKRWWGSPPDGVQIHRYGRPGY